jgi:hypothetical protein
VVLAVEELAVLEASKILLVMKRLQLLAVQPILAVVEVEILHLFTTVAQHKLALVLAQAVQE